MNSEFVKCAPDCDYTSLELGKTSDSSKTIRNTFTELEHFKECCVKKEDESMHNYKDEKEKSENGTLRCSDTMCGNTSSEYQVITFFIDYLQFCKIFEFFGNQLHS